MFFFAALSLLLSTNPVSADFKFVRPEADQASYGVGSKAILFAHIDRKPVDSDYELHLEFLFNGEKVNVVQLSDDLAVALPARFQNPGDFDLELQVAQQNKTVQRSLESTQAVYQIQIDGLRRQLDVENDPEARALIQDQIGFYQARVDALSNRMEQERVLLEMDHLPLEVLVARKQNAGALSAFSGAADRSPATYSVGEKAIFTFHPNTGFTGPDGPKENVFSSAIDGTSIGQARKSGQDYVISSSLFAAGNVGEHSLTTTFSVRSQKQGDALRNASALAAKRVASLTKARDASTNDADRAYYDSKINELNAVSAAISAQLSAVLLPIGTLSIPFTVTN